MFRIRTAFATLALIVGLGSTSQAQMFNPGVGGFGMNGIQGGFGGYQMGFGQQFGVGGGFNPYLGATLPYGNGYGVPLYPYYNNYYAPIPQTYNTLDSLMDSIQSSTSRRDGWRRWPR